jgi:adenosine deaminase CECR1
MAGQSYLPDLSQLSVQDILTARSNLIEAEQKLTFYNEAKQTTLEERAGEIVSRIKQWEETNVHGVHNDGSGWEAGHKFLLGLPTLPRSRLMAIASKAPKAGLLHCHFDVLLPPQALLNDARRQDNLFIKTDVPLISEGLFTHALPQFALLSRADTPEPGHATNLFSKTYLAGSFMRYSTFLESFPGGAGKGEDWVRQKMTLGSDVVHLAQQTVDG